MSTTCIELTKEQRSVLAAEMGLVCDQLVLSLVPDDKSLKISDLGENLILALSQTYTTS